MSQDAVEVARRAFEAFNLAFAEGADDLYEVLDPDVEWIPVMAVLEGRTYHGTEAVRRWVAELRQDWAAFEVKPEQFRDLGEGRVLALGSWRAQGRRGAVPLDFPQAAWLLQIRGERVTRLRAYTDRVEALEAAGLQDQAT
jgi:ketosteroid isomerase-like protein